MPDGITPLPASDIDRRLPLIQHAPLFRGLSREQCREMAARARDWRVERKQVFFREGEPAREAFLLCSGRAKIAQLCSGGQEVLLRLVGPGDLLGGLGILPGCAYPTTATALEASHGLSWERASLEDLLGRVPRLGRNAVWIMAERLRSLEERYCELAIERVPRRLAAVLVHLTGDAGRPSEGGILISLSREELAQMIGSSHFSVSRLLTEWQSQGLLTAVRGGVLIHDRGILADMLDGRPEHRLPARVASGT